MLKIASMNIPVTLSKNLKTLPSFENLGFGQYFSDHIFVSRYTTQKGWFESKVVPYEPLLLDPAASVLHYGQALFEGMKAFKQPSGKIAIFRPEFNHQRLCDGAARLCLNAPPYEIFINGIKELIKTDSRWIPDTPNSSLYIRPTLIGTEGFLGVRPSNESLFFVILSPSGNYFSGGDNPVKIWVEENYLRAAPGGLGATKAGANYASSLKAALEAKQKGYSQVLWLDIEHKGIEEVGTMNVFFVFKNKIVTPALNGSILPGGTRDCVIQLLKKNNHKVEETKITIQEVIDGIKSGNLLEAFGTGTAAVISPIGELFYKNQTHIINNNQNGNLSLELRKTISDIQRGQAPDLFSWLQII